MTTRVLFILGTVVFIRMAAASFHAAGPGLLEHLIVMRAIPANADTLLGQAIWIYRMDLDVTGDGKPELFIGTTWGAGRRGMPWVVYSPHANGQYRPMGLLYFAYSSFYYSRENSTILVPVAGNATEDAFTYYHLGPAGIWEITDRHAGVPRQDVPKMDAWQANGRPPVFQARLQDLRSAQRPTWRDADTDKIVPSLGWLRQTVTESGDCSAERILHEYRGAGCLAPFK